MCSSRSIAAAAAEFGGSVLWAENCWTLANGTHSQVKLTDLPLHYLALSYSLNWEGAAAMLEQQQQQQQ